MSSLRSEFGSVVGSEATNATSHGDKRAAGGVLADPRLEQTSEQRTDPSPSQVPRRRHARDRPARRRGREGEGKGGREGGRRREGGGGGARAHDREGRPE